MPLMAGRYVAPQHFNIPNKNNDPLYDLDPAEVATWERESGPLGSNPGGMHKAPDGSEYYVKAYSGANGDDRTKNEKLTNELYRLAGVPVPNIKLTRWRDHTALASPIIEGEKLDRFEPREYPHIKDLLEHFPIILLLITIIMLTASIMAEACVIEPQEISKSILIMMPLMNFLTYKIQNITSGRASSSMALSLAKTVRAIRLHCASRKYPTTTSERLSVFTAQSRGRRMTRTSRQARRSPR